MEGQDRAFTAGVVPGGLTSHREIKILICCVLSALDAPFRHDMLLQSLTDDCLTNYFEAASAISELLDFGHIRLIPERGYLISDSGRTIAELLFRDLPRSVREKVLAKSETLLKKQINESQHLVKIIERPDGGFIVRGSIIDMTDEIFALEIYAPNRMHAENIKQNFVDNGADILKDAMARLVGLPNEK